MLRTLFLLVATLAAVSLAAPASKRDSHSGSFSFGFGSGSKTSSFKATSGGHRRHDHRDPRAEIARVYSKYHWSVTLPWSGTTIDLEFPDSSYQGGDSSSDGSDGSYGGSYGLPGDSSSDSSPVGAPETSAVSSVATSFSTAYQTSDAVAATSPDSYATASYAPAEPSSSPVDATSVSSYAPRTSAAASPTAAPQTGDGGGETGEVTASPEENESEYLSPVIIGGQKLNLNFDTGSADLWVFSTSLSSSQLGDHSAYDPTKSSTWEDYPEGSWEIGYGDGSGASGTVGFDTVDVGGATATRQAVELATVVSSEFVSDENNDGLLGLAFGKINTVEPKQQQSFFENVADQLDEKLFTADLDVDASGTYEFGKLDSSKYQGELHTTPIDNSRGFWEFSSSTYSIGGKDTQNYNASPAIADTGTSLMMVDDAVAKAYYAQIEGATMNDQAGGYTYPCDANIPSFGVAIGNDGFIATLNGSDIEYAKIGGNTCFGGIQGNSGQGLQIYGAVLLKQYFAVFNFGDLTFGLAQKN